MRILLFGATGMAGVALKNELLQRGIEVIGLSRSGSDLYCDITDETQITEILSKYKYEALINAAAQTDISRCELDPLESWRVNAKAVSILANFSHELNIPLLQISTDHFYTYGEDYPHKETDPVFCVNEYARHKYAAEAFALSSPKSLILRTSILGVRKNGAKSLIQWAMENLLNQTEVELFHDAWTSSLDVETFAKFALKLFLDERCTGRINLASSEVYSKEQLIRKIADMLGIDHSKCFSGSIKRVSKRPNCLGLDATLAQSFVKDKLPKLDDVCINLIQRHQLKSVKYQ
jgi:dTDP-4-dehydrorhamnose reductase